MSDAQFVARDPDSAIVRQARRTLREIKAARPDFLVVNGDLVDEGSPGGPRLRPAGPRRGARRRAALVLRAGQPRGDGREDRQLRRASSAPRSGRSTTRAPGSSPSTPPASACAAAASPRSRSCGPSWTRRRRTASVGSVMVIEHVPPRDPTVQKGSQLERPQGGRARWNSGSPTSAVRPARARLSSAATSGSSTPRTSTESPTWSTATPARRPPAPPDEGGFTGWSPDRRRPRLAGANRPRRARQPWRGGPDWLSVQTRAHVDALALDAPSELVAGERATVSATGHPGGAEPCRSAFPLSADWTGSPNVRIGDADGARRHAHRHAGPGHGHAHRAPSRSRHARGDRQR